MTYKLSVYRQLSSGVETLATIRRRTRTTSTDLNIRSIQLKMSAVVNRCCCFLCERC